LFRGRVEKNLFPTHYGKSTYGEGGSDPRRGVKGTKTIGGIEKNGEAMTSGWNFNRKRAWGTVG